MAASLSTEAWNKKLDFEKSFPPKARWAFKRHRSDTKRQWYFETSMKHKQETTVLTLWGKKILSWELIIGGQDNVCQKSLFFFSINKSLFQLRVVWCLHLMKTSSVYMQTTTSEGFLGGCAVYSPNMSHLTLRMSPFKNVVPVFSTVRHLISLEAILFPHSFKTTAASSSLTVLHCAIVTFVPFWLRF